MSEPAKHLTVIVDVENASPQANAWLQKLGRLVSKAPEEVRVSLYETGEHTFGIKEVKAFFKAQNYKQWSASAQHIFDWLIAHLHHKLVVICKDCRLRFGQGEDCCRCVSKGSAGENYWVYTLSEYHHSTLAGWLIITSSLHRVDPDDFSGPGMGDISRQRALELIEFFKNQ